MHTWCFVHFKITRYDADGLIGMAIVGGAALAFVGLVGATVAALKKKSNQWKSKSLLMSLSWMLF